MGREWVPLTLPAAAAVGSQECKTPGTKHATMGSLPSHPCSQECLLSLQDLPLPLSDFAVN